MILQFKIDFHNVLCLIDYPLKNTFRSFNFTIS
jgi:hypothetical protein